MQKLEWMLLEQSMIISRTKLLPLPWPQQLKLLLPKPLLKITFRTTATTGLEELLQEFKTDVATQLIVSHFVVLLDKVVRLESFEWHRV